jgi:hypothetical protein
MTGRRSRPLLPGLATASREMGRPRRTPKIQVVSAGHADDSLGSLFRDSFEPIARLMIKVDEQRRASASHRKHATEADLKAAVHEVLGAKARRSGLALRATELSISPKDWPRVGPVDVVLTAAGRAGTAEAFVELKWAREDKLWHCAWDLAKAALVSRVGLARRSLLFVGASHRERATRYGGLLRDEDRTTAQFLRRYADAIKPFCFRDDGHEHPRGPYRLPPHFLTAVVAEHPFRLRAEPWTLTLLDVLAPPEGDCIAVDDRGGPIAAAS